jgi:Protein of unknown function (DUF1999)
VGLRFPLPHQLETPVAHEPLLEHFLEPSLGPSLGPSRKPRLPTVLWVLPDLFDRCAHSSQMDQRGCLEQRFSRAFCLAPRRYTLLMIYRPPQDADFPGMQALDLELLRSEHANFDQLPAREREGLVRSSLPSLRFYARSEHSFVCIEAALADPLEPTSVLGFVLAQSVWMGDKAMVWTSSLRVHHDAPSVVLPGLLHAVTKSAYDGAVYEIHLAAEKHLLPFADREGYVDGGAKHLVRLLGTRSVGAASDEES